MKICFIVGEFPNLKCGVGDYTSMLANSLAEKGEDVSIITAKGANSINGKLHVYNIIEEYNVSAIKDITAKIKEIKPDVVHIQYPSNMFVNRKTTSVLLPLCIKLRFRKIKLIETLHEYLGYSWRSKKLYSMNYRAVDYCIIVERIYEEYIKRDFNKIFNKIKIKHIPIGSSIPKSNISENERIDLKSKLNLNNCKILSYFGFANPKKGIELLFESLKYIKDDNIKLLYIGELDKDKEYHKQLLDLIRSLDIRNRIIMTGFIENPVDVSNYLSISDVCVLPFTDGVQIRNSSFLAAYNQDINIITTSTDNTDDGNGTYYIKPNSAPELLAKKIKSVIYKEKPVRTNSKLNWDNISDEHLKIYKEITKK